MGQLIGGSNPLLSAVGKTTTAARCAAVVVFRMQCASSKGVYWTISLVNTL
jgi:hypothetical protein